MKYIVVLGDGMADYPLEELGEKTPLEYAKTPMMDQLAQKSEIGQVHTIPAGMSPGSDTANLSVLGYDPKKYYTGRSPLEALSIGVPMKDTDIAIRCNIVTVSEEEAEYKDKKMIDHSSDEISTEDADVLIRAVQEAFGVKVKAVNTVNVKGKLKRQGRSEGYTSDIKKAYVTLTDDSDTIKFFESLS